jgi:transcriptional regulator with XRE-family HTH domain
MTTPAEVIYRLRHTLDLTQTELAIQYNECAPLELQTTRQDISRYETGRTIPPGDKLLKFLSLARAE